MGHLAPMSCRPVLLPLCLAAVLASPVMAQTDEDAVKQDMVEKQAKEQADKAAEAAKARNQAAVDGFARGAQPPLPPPVVPAGGAPVQPNAPGNAQGNAPANAAQGNRAPGAAAVGGAVANPAPRGQNRGGAPAAGAVAPGGGSTATTANSGSAQGSVPKIQESGDFYILNLDEEGESLDLLWLTKMCQVATGKNFNFDQKVVQPALLDAKVRMFGEKRIPKAEFYEFYQILMFIHGFTITKVGPDHLAVFLIQSSSPAQAAAGKAVLKDEAIYILPDELDKYADQVATQIMTVLHLPNTDVRTLGSSLRGIVGGQGSEQTIMPVANTQSVVLRGFAPQVVSIARILKLVDDLAGQDTGITPQFDVIPLEFAAAEDLSDILEQLLEARKREAQTQRQANPQGATGQISGGGGESKILTYPRTNSLLVMALPEDMAAIKELVARLDVEVVEPERTYHVYALDHVKAEDLAEVLEDFIEGASRVTAGAGGGRGAAQPAAQGLSSRDNEVIVVADETTNSLLIAASRRRYEEVVELIQRLDRRQEQVLIETALIELTGSETLDLGVELGGADLPGSGSGSFGLTNFGLSTFEDSDGDGVF
ncbi:MAG: secretin N-terminal domain-containing protein, partial [Planctomycetota bacterium]